MMRTRGVPGLRSPGSGGQQTGHHRDQKRGGFSGPGLGLAESVFSDEDPGHDFRLDGRAIGKSQIENGVHEGFRQIKIMKPRSPFLRAIMIKATTDPNKAPMSSIILKKVTTELWIKGEMRISLASNGNSKDQLIINLIKIGNKVIDPFA